MGPLLSSSPNKRPSLRIFRTLPAHEHRLPTVILVTLGLHGLPAAYCAAGWLEPLPDCIEHGGSPLHIIRLIQFRKILLHYAIISTPVV